MLESTSEHKVVHLHTLNIYLAFFEFLFRGQMPKGVTRTIRITQETESALLKLAGEEGTSVNFLANKAMTTFLEWNAVAKKFGLCSVAGSLMNKLIECHDEDKCEELGRWSAKETIKPFADYLFGQLTFENAFEILRKFSYYGGRFEFAEVKDNQSYTLLLKHSSGRKWSIYYAGMLESIYKEMLGKNIRTNITEDLCIAKIDLKGS